MAKHYYYGIHHEESWCEEDTEVDRLLSAAADCTLQGLPMPRKVRRQLNKTLKAYYKRLSNPTREPSPNPSQESSPNPAFSVSSKRDRGYGFLTYEGVRRLYGEYPSEMDTTEVFVEKDGDADIDTMALAVITNSDYTKFCAYLGGPDSDIPSWTWDRDPAAESLLRAAKKAKSDAKRRKKISDFRST